MKLNWYRRSDGLWNADCACGSMLCGFEAPNAILRGKTAESWHFDLAKARRDQGVTVPKCGPVNMTSA